MLGRGRNCEMGLEIYEDGEKSQTKQWSNQQWRERKV